VVVTLDEWGRPMMVVEDVDLAADDIAGDATARPPDRRSGVEEGKGTAQVGGRVVEEVVEEWVVVDEWWRTPIHRRYVEVVLEGGAHVVLFENLVSGEWFMQRP
jgi:hypothetical protein